VDPLTFLRSQPDRALAVLSGVVGVVLLIDGWYGVSGQGIVAGQLPYLISCGLGGIFALATATTLWLSADLRDEWRKMDAVEAAILAQTEVLRALHDAGVALPTPEPPAAPIDDGRARHRVAASPGSRGEA
jgi:hypothetical protein